MKRVLILAGIGILCFLGGTVGIYVAMPSLSPERVDSTRVRLDSLGLIVNTEPVAVASALPDTLRSMATDSTDTTAVADALPSLQDLIQTLRDSLDVSNQLIRSLQADTSALIVRMDDLRAQIEALTAKDVEATELGKSLAKLDAKQLGNILAGLDLDIIDLLYQKASARDRTRLLESMSPEQAARFVHTLVKGPPPEADLETQEPEADPTNMADQASANQ